MALGRLRSKSDFDLVFKKGRTVISNDKKIKVKYLFTKRIEKENIKIGLSITSKAGNSVWRNRLKRIIREALKKENEILISLEKQNKVGILIIFSPYSINQNNSKKIFLNNVKDSVSDILLTLQKLTSVHQF